MVSGGTMAPNKVDTLTFVVNVTLNGQKGPFFTQAEIQGTKKDNTVVKAKSSAGSDINDENKKPTGLTFGLPNTRIGLAKEVVSKTLDSTNYWTVTYNIFVSNLGNNNITNLSVTDSLDKVFTNKGAKVVSVKTSGEPGITIDSTYTGQGLNVNLLKPSASVLDVGKTAKIGLVVRVNTSAATDSVFSNVAIGKGLDKDNVFYTDISTKGKNPDPNFDGNPNENEATPVTLNGKATQPSSNNIGLAMKADTAKQADGSYNVTYTLRAINYGKVGLRSLRLCDTLKKEFGDGVQYTMVGTPMVVRGTMKADSTFNGDGKVGLIVADSTKILAPGDSIAVKFTVNIAGNSRTDEILNRAVVKGQTVTDKKTVFDISTNGINPDVAGDGPSNDSTPTPIKLPKRDLVFFIPDGFSPNGDTKNDAFVVEGVPSDETVTLQVYNRWGNVVYGKENYNGDWSGQSNLGVRLSDGALPDGSYLICVERKKKADPTIALKPIFKMITIVR
jgi:large repetitive protein